MKSTSQFGYSIWRYSRVTVARQAEEQVFGLLPGLDDNPFENNIIDHGSLHMTGTKKAAGILLQQDLRPANVCAACVTPGRLRVACLGPIETGCYCSGYSYHTKLRIERPEAGVPSRADTCPEKSELFLRKKI